MENNCVFNPFTKGVCNLRGQGGRKIPARKLYTLIDGKKYKSTKKVKMHHLTIMSMKINSKIKKN